MPSVFGVRETISFSSPRKRDQGHVLEGQSCLGKRRRQQEGATLSGLLLRTPAQANTAASKAAEQESDVLVPLSLYFSSQKQLPQHTEAWGEWPMEVGAVT